MNNKYTRRVAAILKNKNAAMGVSRVTRVSVFVDRFASWLRKFFLFGARVVITNVVLLSRIELLLQRRLTS